MSNVNFTHFTWGIKNDEGKAHTGCLVCCQSVHQEAYCCQSAFTFLQLYNDEGVFFELNCDELWVHLWTPKTKEASKVRKQEEEEMPLTRPDTSPINMRTGGGKFSGLFSFREATKFYSLIFLVLFLACDLSHNHSTCHSSKFIIGGGFPLTALIM